MYNINIFFIYSIIGYIYEIILAFLLGNKLNSGFLYGPWTPIYGIGVLIILKLSRYIFKKIKLNKILKLIILFILIITILTLIEFIAGHLINYLFHKDYWNYSNIPINIGKYIALPISLAWGLASLFVIYYIHPFIKKITTKIPLVVTIILIILFTTDLGLTLYFGLGS